MKYSIIISFIILLYSSQIHGQHLNEQDWAQLSTYIKSDDKSGFEEFLKEKDFLISNEPNEKYAFYNWKKKDGFYYGVRMNKVSGQVTYMTNDQNYVLKLLSRFVSDYSLIKSEKKGERSTTHLFDSQSTTIAVKLDTATDTGTHLLFAVNKS